METIQTQDSDWEPLEKRSSREWDRSEWFRRWLELIRESAPEQPAH